MTKGYARTTDNKYRKFRGEVHGICSETHLSKMDNAAKDVVAPDLVRCKKAGNRLVRKQYCQEVLEAGKRHPFLLNPCKGCPKLEEENAKI